MTMQDSQASTAPFGALAEAGMSIDDITELLDGLADAVAEVASEGGTAASTEPPDATPDLDVDDLTSFLVSPPATPEELEAQLDEARNELAALGRELIDATIRFVPRWWDRAVEEAIESDPARTIAVAASLPDLKINLLHLRTQVPDLVAVTIGPVLPDPWEDAEVGRFRPLLSGHEPSRLIEGPLRVLLGAVAGQLHKAGLISPGGKHSFTVHADVWRYRFGIDLGELRDVFARYDAQFERIQLLLGYRVELDEALAKAHAIALWQQA